MNCDKLISKGIKSFGDGIVILVSVCEGQNSAIVLTKIFPENSA